MGLGTTTAADFFEGSAFGNTNNTTAVTAVAAPASGKRRLIRSVSIHNADTASATATIRLNDSNSGNNFIIDKQTITSGSTYLLDRVLVLASTTESLQIILAAAITTNHLDYVVVYAEVA
jgi:hypothetical protein